MKATRQIKRAEQRKRQKAHETTQKDAMVVEYFQSNPVEFIESVLEIKLTKWQKIVFKIAWIGNHITRGKANGEK